ILLPCFFGGVPFLLMFGMGSIQGGQAFQDPKIEQVARTLQMQFPDMAAMDIKSVVQVHIFRQFLIFLLLIPSMGAMTNATYSIVGEKENRSLEPLLATPITVAELLLGKSLACAGPAILMSWFAAGLYSVGVRGLCGPAVYAHVLNWMGLVIIFLVAPLIAIL